MAPAVDPDAFLVRLAEIRKEIAARHAGTPAGKRLLRLLARLETVLARPPRIALLGEVNAGKSTLANRILGTDLLTADVIASTRHAVLMRHAPTPSLAVRRAGGARISVDQDVLGGLGLAAGDLIEVCLPLEPLRRFELLDTPPFSRDAGGLGVPGAARVAECMIWCTLATQAWRASEVAAWRSLARAPQTSLLVATHADLLSEADREKVRRRLATEAGALFRSIEMSGPAAEGPDGGTLSATIDVVAREVAEERCRRALALTRRHVEAL